MKKVDETKRQSRGLMWLTALLLSAVVTACGGGGGGGSDAGRDPILGGGAVLAPRVTAVTPLQNATGVPVNTRTITAAFSKAMNPATLNTSTFTLACPAGTPRVGTVSYAPTGNVATLTLISNLPPSTICTATITTGAQDTTGNALASNFVWTFTTGVTPDTTAPTVISTVPVANAIGVPVNTNITASFSEAMNPLTITNATFTLACPAGTPITGTVSYAVNGNVATFDPAANLPVNTICTATITTGARDVAGNALAGPYIWTFTTGATTDTTPPTVTSVNPANLATGVCLQQTINATFSEPMDPLTINTATVTLRVTSPPLGAAVSGTVAYDAPSRVATLTPTSPLLANTNYTATVTTGTRDLAGNALAVNRVWTFTTGGSACSPGPSTPPPLGPVAPFGGFGGNSGMTNQGILTVINGDIGTTAASTLITGFHNNEVPYTSPALLPPAGAGCTYSETTLNIGTVNGGIFTAPPPPTPACPNQGTAATKAVADAAALAAQAAFNDLSPASRPGGTDPGAGQLGGLTLPPAIYQAASGSFQITGTDLVLDGQGNANALWVFQMASTLTVGGPGAPRSVILINGAQAKNVFWRVGSAATINGAGGGTMVGTIIASAGVTFSTAGNVAIVTLNGRALSLNASVTLVNTVINVPGP